MRYISALTSLCLAPVAEAAQMVGTGTSTPKKNDFKGLDFATLGHIDPATLQGEERLSLLESQAKAFRDSVESSIIIDRLSGQVFLFGQYAGTVAGECEMGGKAKKWLPSIWTNAESAASITPEMAEKGMAEIRAKALAANRLMFLAATGNSFHQEFQKGKGVLAVAQAARKAGGSRF